MSTVHKKINLKNLFVLCQCDNDKYFEVQKPKYNIKIKSTMGFVQINGLVKKNNIECVNANIDGKNIKGADKHLVKFQQSWRYLDSFEHEIIPPEDLYDVSLDDPHEYLTNNEIIHHNTTTAKALVNEIGSDYVYINMSAERGLDVLRDRIAKFATSYSMFGENRGGKKICILDEFDGSTPVLQSALRAFMEEFQDSCRFILTCNYATKIIDPLKSRCQLIDFNMTDKTSQEELVPQMTKRLCGILKTEGVTFQVETIEKIVKTFYPDIRRMVGLLQQYSKQNMNIDSGIFDYEKVDIELYDLILNKKLTSARKFIIERNYNADEMYRQLFDNFVPMLPKEKQGQVILIIAEYMYRSGSGVLDKEINLVACLLEIISLI